MSEGPCKNKHTPSYPGKDRARKRCFQGLDKSLGIIIISQAGLPALNWLDWEGQITVCDSDKTCVDAAKQMRRHYPFLKKRIKAYHLSIQDLVRLYCKKGAKPLAAIDLDLAFTLENALPTLNNVLQTLSTHKVHTTVFLTYVNHRDKLSKNGNRDENVRRLIEGALPAGMKYTDSFTYKSSWWDEHLKFSQGSSMAVAKIET